MCVDTSRSARFGRAEFLGTLGIAAAPLFAGELGFAATFPTSQPAPPPLTVPSGLAAGNATAARIAAASALVGKTHAATVSLARSIADARLRADVLALLDDPKPAYAAKYPTPEARATVRDALLREGFIDAATPLEAIFPAGTEAAAQHAPQPFWCAGGSDGNSHHSYPGGLLVHECWNASIATQLAATYDRVYFDNRAAVDCDTAIGAALYHDVMKTVVFQWNDDGTLFREYPIGATGGHHVLSGAEAIVRGRSARFVIALLSAHAAPSLGDESKVATWCRAAALIAGVDPVDYGLLKRDGAGYKLAPSYVPIEAFVNYLSDHDFVLTIHAVRAVLPELLRLAPHYVAANVAGSSSARRYATFAWFKNDVLANLSATGLYQTLASRGQTAFDRTVQHYVAHNSTRARVE